MKKNGYLRKFIAMFLVFVMLMADSSMTTFASSFTVGRVKQQNADEGIAVQSADDQYNVQINADAEFDWNAFINAGYQYVMLGKTTNGWPGIEAVSTVESISGAGNVTLKNIKDTTDSKIYFVKGPNNWQWSERVADGDYITQGENKFKITVTSDESNTNDISLNINKVNYIQHNVQINADAEFDLSSFANEYRYAVIGKINSSGNLEAISDVEAIDSITGQVVLNVEEGIDETDSNLYFVKNVDKNAWNDRVSDGNQIKQNDNKFAISVTKDANDSKSYIINIEKVEIIQRSVQFNVDKEFDLNVFTNEFKYVVLGKTTSTGIENVSTVEKIDNNGGDIILKVDKDKNDEDLKLYFIKDTNNLENYLSDGKEIKQGNYKFKISVTKDKSNTNNLIVSIEKEKIEPGKKRNL